MKDKKVSILYYNRAMNVSEGPAIHARELLIALKDSSPEVYVYPEPIGINYAKKPVFGSRRHIIVETCKECARLIRGGVNTWRDYKKLVKIINERSVDVIISRNFEFNAAAVLAQKKFGIPAIIEVNGLLYLERMKGGWDPFIPIRRLVEKYILKRAAGLYAVSDELKKIILAEGITVKCIETIPNGVDLRKFDRRISINPQLQSLSVNNLVIGFTGSLKKWHGVDILIESFAMLSREVKNVILVIIGDGHERHNLEKLIQQLDLSDKVFLLGKVDHVDIPSYITGFDIAVAPYRDDGSFYFSPLKVFEYMAMAKPVVASCLGQLTTIIENGVNGILTEPNNRQSLFMELNNLVSNVEKRKMIGENAYKKITNNYLWSHAAQKIIIMYEKIVGS